MRKHNKTIEEICSYIVDSNGFTESDYKTAKYLLLDNLGCVIGAVAFPPIQNTLRAYKSYISTSSIIDPFILGTLGNALDFDDTYILTTPPVTCHPGSAIVPTVLSCALYTNSSIKEVLDAIIVGYNAGLIFGHLSATNTKSIQGMGSWIALGACAAASRMLKLPILSVARSLSLTTKFSPLPTLSKFADYKSGEVDWIKNNLGWASLAGMMSAIMTAEGVQGPHDAFFEPGGYFSIVHATNKGMKEIGLNNISSYIHKVALKPYPCCRFTHSSIEAIEELMTDDNVDTYDENAIDSISVELASKFASTNLNNYPRNVIDAQFSIPYLLSARILLGSDYLEWLEEKSINRKDLKSLSSKINLSHWRGNKHMTLAAKVQMNFSCGIRKQTTVEVPLGDPLKPLTEEMMNKKFYKLTYSKMRSSSELFFKTIIQCNLNEPFYGLLLVFTKSLEKNLL